MTCDCMTEPDPLDPDGDEVVLIHSLTCEEHPDYEPHDLGRCTCDTCDEDRAELGYTKRRFM